MISSVAPSSSTWYCARSDPFASGLTTVYRVLQSMTEQNITEAQHAEHGETLYRLRTGTGHRHYLLCRACGQAVGFTPTDFELDDTNSQHNTATATSPTTLRNLPSMRPQMSDGCWTPKRPSTASAVQFAGGSRRYGGARCRL